MTTGRPGRGLVLVTSGLGPRCGGVGVVSAQLAKALGIASGSIWRHQHEWPAALRRAGLVGRAALGALAWPRLVLYEHLDLAVVHQLIPWLATRPYAIFLHGTEAWRALEGRRRRAVAGAAILLANSGSTVAEARRRNPWLPPVAVTHLGVEPAVEGPPAGQRPPIALMVGRMAAAERYKGHAEVLAAWPRIRAAEPRAELIVVGSGDDQGRLAQLARGLPGVRFTGWVEDQERLRLFRECRVFLQPSLREGFGLAALEAASAGMAVVGLKGTVLEELLPQAGSVALARSQAPDDLLAAVVPLLRDADLATSVGRAGRARVLEHFRQDQFVARVRAALATWVT